MYIKLQERMYTYCTKFKMYNAKLYFTSDITYLNRNSIYNSLQFYISATPGYTLKMK